VAWQAPATQRPVLARLDRRSAEHEAAPASHALPSPGGWQPDPLTLHSAREVHGRSLHAVEQQMVAVPFETQLPCWHSAFELQATPLALSAVQVVPTQV
jgi:hypothetical protein